jgi:hypothetical protein
MDSLDTYDLLKLSQEAINHLNRTIKGREIEEVIKNIPKTKVWE